MSHSFHKGQRVTFKTPGLHSVEVTATVEHVDGSWLTTKDESGKVRKTRAGAARAA